MEEKVYEKNSLGWFREQAKKDGFDSIAVWNNLRRKKLKEKKLAEKKPKEKKPKEKKPKKKKPKETSEIKQKELKYIDIGLIKTHEVKQRRESNYIDEYADCIRINGEFRWVIVDKTGNIIDNNPGTNYIFGMKSFYQKNCKQHLSNFPMQFYEEYEKELVTENFNDKFEYSLENVDEKICKLLKESIVPIEDIVQINTEQVYGELCDIRESSRLKGVYILILEGEKPYIGSTKNIYVRFRKHRKNYDNILSIVYLKTKDMEDAILLEDWLKRNSDCSNKCNVISDTFWYGHRLKKTTI